MRQTRVQQVEAETNRIFISTGAWHAGAKELELLAKALAAEVDARDEVITRLLAMLEPGKKPNCMDPKYNPSKMPPLTEYNLDCMWYGMRKQSHARALEIAGRTE